MKILVTGASGFIGTRLCERLALHWHLPFRALVHTYARAARLARLDVEIQQCDLSDVRATEAAARGCDAVVHLAYGRDSTTQTRNVLRACARGGVKRLVHISSMAVHGPSPGPECAHEATATIGRYRSAYSDSKAEIEELVQRDFDRRLVAGLILRPTVVFGPYSPFVLGVVQAARSGTVALIDDGAGICNAVYVDDVCSAIHRALTTETGLGRAFFVNADRATTWREFNLTFATAVNPDVRVVSVSSAESLAYWRSLRPTLRTNVREAARLAVSPALYGELSRVPLVGSAITFAKRQVKRAMGAERISRLKGIPRFETAGEASSRPNESRVRRESFPIEFSNAEAHQVLGWQPAYSFEQGAELTLEWLRFARLVP